jgi:short subunit dehydrogenase-like uncharacterized protein
MASECAMALAFDERECPAVYGVITPSVAFGQRLVERMKKCDITMSVTTTAPGQE